MLLSVILMINFKMNYYFDTLNNIFKIENYKKVGELNLILIFLIFLNKCVFMSSMRK